MTKIEELIAKMDAFTQGIDKMLREFEWQTESAEDAKNAKYHRESIVVTYAKFKAHEVEISELQLVLARADKYIKGMLGMSHGQ